MDVILPPRTLPSDESKFYLFNCYSRWAQDGEEMANQLPSVKAEEMWQEKAYLFVWVALKLRNRSKILEGLLSWLFFNSMDCSLPGSSVHWILQARMLEWVQSSSVQSLSCVWLFVTPWTAAHQASLSITNSRSLLKLMSIKLVMPFSHLILCSPLLLLPSIIPSIRVFLSECIL